MSVDPFSLLEMPRAFRLDVETLEQHYRSLQRALHPDRFTQASASERRLSMQKAMDVNEAYKALKDPLLRAEALLPKETSAARENRTSGSALMFEMMELQEMLSEAKAGNAAQLQPAVDAIEARYQTQLERLEKVFDHGEGDEASRAELVDGLRYITRLKNEARRLLRARENEA